MTAFRLIKEVQKIYKTRESEQREREVFAEEKNKILNVIVIKYFIYNTTGYRRARCVDN